jgi:hypothetical protein
MGGGRGGELWWGREAIPRNNVAGRATKSSSSVKRLYVKGCGMVSKGGMVSKWFTGDGWVDELRCDDEVGGCSSSSPILWRPVDVTVWLVSDLSTPQLSHTS